ncbi:hypothetical protein BAUCODRAFT_33364 [Baudoinia panamericana UAMH 10762]|uniref:Uncharacterized protein n=1 Tax=Baudoinia panamericana (strain UAMH 10762) TaxID=717646 RepID=M2N128_BAUPA|nr:uncharacterized protein BAUCODRAFT_33364 [Baudoinia panamericana UAMH 10762]EMC97638.1 hypothetical protein BAUCODRAFT_33364 [Baudoinia panamericana UAMH 10762]
MREEHSHPKYSKEGCGHNHETLSAFQILTLMSVRDRRRADDTPFNVLHEGLGIA